MNEFYSIRVVALILQGTLEVMERVFTIMMRVSRAAQVFQFVGEALLWFLTGVGWIMTQIRAQTFEPSKSVLSKIKEESPRSILIADYHANVYVFSTDALTQLWLNLEMQRVVRSGKTAIPRLGEVRMEVSKVTGSIVGWYVPNNIWEEVRAKAAMSKIVIKRLGDEILME